MNTSKFEKKKTVHMPQYFGKTKRENLSGLLFFKVNTKKKSGNVTFNSYSFTDSPPPTPPPPPPFPNKNNTRFTYFQH